MVLHHRNTGRQFARPMLFRPTKPFPVRFVIHTIPGWYHNLEVRPARLYISATIAKNLSTISNATKAVEERIKFL